MNGALPSSGDFIGTGWAYPAVVASNGSVQLAGGTAELNGAIRCILETRVGERVMRPEFGSRIWDYMFEPITARTLGLVEQAAREALARWEPRITLESVDASPGPEEGLILIDVAYRARSTNDRRNLVYPYYSIPREARP